MKIKTTTFLMFLFLICGWFIFDCTVSAVEGEPPTIESEEMLPELDLQISIGTDCYYDEKQEIYWFGSPSVVVSAAIENWEEFKSPYVMRISTDEEFWNTVEIMPEDNIGKVPVEFENAGTTVNYYLKIVDAEGTESTVQKLQLGYDDCGPEITEVQLTQLNGDEWINAEEFSGESKVSFSIKATDGQSGIGRIEYSYDGGENYIEAVYSERNETYKFTAKEAIPDGTGYQWKVRVFDNVNHSSNEAELEGGKIDTNTPETKAYIRFFSDTVGANDLSHGSILDGKWSGNIFEITQKIWHKIWGKKEIKFEVYVRDVTSGIETITISYNGENIPEQNVKRQDDLKVFQEGESSASETEDLSTGYTVFEGTITCDKDAELMVGDFGIERIVDRAGNELKQKLLLNNAENEQLIFLDTVEPVLKIQVDKEEAIKVPQKEEKVFYNEAKKLKFIIEEKFFAQEKIPVYPKVEIRNSSDETVLWTSKAWKHLKDDLWQLEISLNEAAEETGYRIIMEAYEDPSGNLMTGTEGINGVLEDGMFESGIFVIDKTVPILKSYSISTPTDCRIDGCSVYENLTKDDVEVTFIIDDHPEYYAPENLFVKIYKTGSTEPVQIINGTEFGNQDYYKLSVEGRNHVYEFQYDGEENTQGEYYITIEYKDRAGNCMESQDLKECKEGCYVSETFIIDHGNPMFDVKYEILPVNIVQNGNSHSGMEASNDGIAYYGEDIKVKFIFDEKYIHLNGDHLQHFEFELWELTNTGKCLVSDEEPAVRKMNGENSKYEACYTIAADKINHKTDGNYQFVLRYKDCAGNIMKPKDTQLEKFLEEGEYRSPVLVMDTTAPEVKVQYTSEITQTYQGRNYFNTHTILNIQITDRNIRYGDLTKELKKFTAKDIYGNDLENTIKEKLAEQYNDTQIWRALGQEEAKLFVNIALTTDANYEIPIYFTDLAGNQANIIQTPAGSTHDAGYVEKVTVDTTIPKIQLSYSSGDQANYLEEGYLFAKENMTVTATATDGTSGIQKIKFTIVDETGKEIVKTKSFEPKGENIYSVSIPLKENDFKGSILAEVIDFAKNSNSQKRNHIIESVSKHSETGRAEIVTMTNPGRTVKGVDYYSSDVKFRLLLEDTYSGIGSWKCIGGNTIREKEDYKSEAGTNLYQEPTKKIVHKVDKVFILDAKENNVNQIFVNAGFEDNAGHELVIEKEYHIDTTKPVITVSYDLNNPANGRYYNETRTATVWIRERNFDASDVQFLFTSTDGSKPEISEWSRNGFGDDQYHSCTVIFNQDSDYTFTVKFMDKAGNQAEYGRVDEFTIDKTNPVATVVYDNQECLNEYYFNEARTATIDIVEHNFDPNAIELGIIKDGSATEVPYGLVWSANGDHNTATILFDADAEYTFDIAGADLALNELGDYQADYFIIDQTAPELDFFDIQHMSANNSTVSPGVCCYDRNYDKKGMSVFLTGYHHGAMKITGKYQEEVNGFQLKYDDFAHTQEMDDLYTMKAVAYDLAGNRSDAMIMFSVNRFGSVYTFDKTTEELIGANGKYYTNQEQPLVITETNADTLEFKEITMNLNGKLTTLKEGVDYTVTSSGNENTWKMYRYLLKAENFTKEGMYTLTIYSEDRASNVSDNNAKGKKIAFVVDKTKPSALISGIKDHGQYRASSKEITIDIEDNVKLEKVAVTIDGDKKVYHSEQLHKMNEKVVLNIGSANHWQEIFVEAEDAAGNKENLEKIRVLITANLWVQFFMNKFLFYSCISGSVLVGVILLILHKKLRISLFNSSSP